MNLSTIIVLLLLCVALGFAIKRVFSKKSGCDCGSCSSNCCGNPHGNHEHTHK
ncbi:Virus attachment protein p12 family protein [Peptoniphilus asaccharolyticus DSM 20463]|uniref:Virus attachment protein p12 family protein n=1 Tax=Peptoniphilus asaccharolyticus DSM 20463 TaxID=573058 RepID=A0A1W1VK98_PEPAS|nr:FeoB-associated Cys-rich membrane protein [Peptoniphilus asaccharolyticus]MBL7574388.1 FeoB-associated Cys-rich membrane protein [Peptoniphilus asaccharolyticus]SMB93364.1 Virus attachment protein p12 family protein [Peptoniphilus asaccharolyticus DSM 20463]